MAKNSNDTEKSEKKEINLSEINADSNITMFPADVNFDSAGRVLITNDRVNEFVKETLVEAGSVLLSPGGADPEKIADINIFCHFEINIRKGCKVK